MQAQLKHADAQEDVAADWLQLDPLHPVEYSLHMMMMMIWPSCWDAAGYSEAVNLINTVTSGIPY